MADFTEPPAPYITPFKACTDSWTTLIRGGDPLSVGKSVNIRSILRHIEKIPMWVGSPHMKYNCAILFLGQMSSLFFTLQNLFA